MKDFPDFLVALFTDKGTKSRYFLSYYRYIFYPGDIALWSYTFWVCGDVPKLLTTWYVFPLQFNSEHTVQIDTSLESANEYR